MTEKEYVEHILKKAKAYIVEVAREPGDKMKMKPIAEWEHVKSMLSAHQAVKLCDAWLEQNLASESAQEPCDTP
jgi:hypothetical protein